MNKRESLQTFAPCELLAVYGTLAPGQSNAHILSPLSGFWVEGTVRGQLVNRGWGSKIGHPGIRLSDSGPESAVLVFCSRDLPAFWAELDAFEGPDYRRVVTRVHRAPSPIQASIYELSESAQ